MSSSTIRIGVGIAALAWCLLAGATACVADMPDPGCGTMVLAPRPGALTLALPHDFLLESADSVWSARGAWREGSDYRLDRTRGELRLLRESMPGETLYVHACWLMAPPPLELHRYEYRPAGAHPDTTPPATATNPSRPGPASHGAAPAGVSLALTGNKSVAVEFGSSQDAVLRQSLDLALTGTLAPGVQLTGVLTDRSTPVTEAGSTLNLQEADQVRLELTAPGGGATLGDLSLRFDDSEFGRLERRLQGASGTWNTHGFSSVVAAASASGEYQRMQFYGVDGLQGPYELTGRDGEHGISVVAGSEIVTLDGARLARGESADYSIDYEAARITFSNRHLITSASRVTVDYQFTLQRYRRNFTAAATRWDLGAVHGFARFMSEADDRGSPLGAVLDGSDRLVLAASGDSTAHAIGPGVTPGAGDYDSVRVTPSRTAFAFAGPDSGQFVVSFAAVGVGKGDYADSALVSGRTVYRYVGAGQGAFVVGQALPLPESHSLWSVGTGIKLGVAHFDIEGAASRHDLNTFSSLDDGDNNGLAGRATLGLEGPPRTDRGPRLADARGARRGRAILPVSGPGDAVRGGALGAARAGRLRAFEAPGGERAMESDQWRAAQRGRRAAVDAGRFLLATRGVRLEPRRRADHARAVGARQFRTIDGARSAGSTQSRARRTVVVGAMVRALGACRDRRAAFSERYRWRGRPVPQRRSHAGERAGLDLAWRRGRRRAARCAAHASGLRGSIRGALLQPVVRQPVGPAVLGHAAGPAPQRHAARESGSHAARISRAHGCAARVRRTDCAGNWISRSARRARTAARERSPTSAPDSEPTMQFGNFVGKGDYDLALGVSSDLERLGTSASRARGAWTFGSDDVWRGSRSELTYEADAQRSGDVKLDRRLPVAGRDAGGCGTHPRERPAALRVRPGAAISCRRPSCCASSGE